MMMFVAMTVFMLMAVFVMMFMIVFGVFFFLFFFRALFKLGNPAGAFKNFFKIEAIRREQFFHRDAAAHGFQNFYVRLKLAHNRADFFHLFFGYQIRFIYDKRRTKFDLLNEQRFNVFLFHIFVEEQAAVGKFIRKPFRIYHTDNIIQASVADCFNRLRNRHRFAHAARFD